MLPFPLNFNVAPSFIPLGRMIYYWFSAVTVPLPEQGLQGEVIFTPSPWQLLHSALSIIIPCLIVMYPVPWQVPHFWGFVPGADLEPLHVLQVVVLLYLIV